METSVSTRGTIIGTQATEVITFVSRPTTSKGVLHGKGKGVIMAEESETATYTGEGIGRLGSSASASWRGFLFLSTSSNGKLSSLNNMIGLFEAEINADEDFSVEIWKWK